MSKTLFFYIFRDLLRIFLIALGVLSGIIAFCGLLKPMTESGLTTSQVMQILTYIMPAAQTYAMPIAALLATTMVYGRLAADNEITACRASGIGYWALVTPAFMLGLVLALLSLTLLCFVVPYCTLKVEQVGVSSMADIVIGSIQRDHHIKVPVGGASFTIYADSAERVIDPEDATIAPGDEVVLLHNPIFCRTAASERPDEQTGKALQVPTEFGTARLAKVVIRRKDQGAQVSFTLVNSAKFTRDPHGADIAAADIAMIGPLSLPSPIRDNTKFMTIPQLQEFYRDPTRHRDIRDFYESITIDEQNWDYITKLIQDFNNGRRLTFDAGDGEHYEVSFERAVRSYSRDPGRAKWISPGSTRDIHVEHVVGQSIDRQILSRDDARDLTLKVQADGPQKLMRIALVLDDSVSTIDEIRPERQSVSRVFTAPMPPEILAIASRGPQWYIDNPHKGHSKELTRLRHKLPTIKAAIIAEKHARASFAVSAFILVVVGSLLGMLFKTGNFLWAFMVAVVPAFFCIALMICGQQVSVGADGKNLHMGVNLIWSGNVIVGALAVGLLGYFKRQ